MAGMETSWEGLNSILGLLTRLGKDSFKEAGKALYQEAKIEEKESRARTPVKRGVLRASHITTEPDYSGEGGTVVSVAIKVGGPSIEYAEVVHENLEAYHPNGQAKFLESTLNESAPHMGERLAARLRSRY